MGLSASFVAIFKSLRSYQWWLLGFPALSSQRSLLLLFSRRCAENIAIAGNLFRKPRNSETGRIRFRGVRFQTPNSVSFFWAHWVPGSELSEFLSAYYLWAKANSPSLTQNSPSSPQNSVSSLLRNSTLETVFRPFNNVRQEIPCQIPLPDSQTWFNFQLKNLTRLPSWWLWIWGLESFLASACQWQVTVFPLVRVARTVEWIHLIFSMLLQI